MSEKRKKCACGRFYLKPRERKCARCKAENRKRTSRAHRVLVTYGLTEVELEAMKAYADGKCMFCGEGRRYNLHVEHDHDVERAHSSRASVRGLACARCNSVLRKAGDSASLLRQLANALDEWPSSYVIDRVVGFTVDRRSK